MKILKSVQGAVLVTLAILLSGCVTTQVGPYDEKLDLARAEQIYVQIGYSHYEQGNLFQAKEALGKALEINSRSAGAHLGIARVYSQEEEFRLADRHFQRAIRFGGETEHRFQYAVFLYNQGDMRGSYRQFDEVVKDTRYVRRAISFEYRGFSALQMNRSDDALASFQRAVTLNNQLASSHISIARIWFERADYVKSYASFQQYTALVRARMATHNASTLWLGIQLADYNNDANAVSSLVLQMRSQFSDSEEYQQYLEWQRNKGTT